MAKLQKTDHITSTYKDLHILKYSNIFTLRFGVFVFKPLHNDFIFHFRVNAGYSVRNKNFLARILLMLHALSVLSYSIVFMLLV